MNHFLLLLTDHWKLVTGHCPSVSREEGFYEPFPSSLNWPLETPLHFTLDENQKYYDEQDSINHEQ